MDAAAETRNDGPMLRPPPALPPLARSRVVVVGDASAPIGRAVALHLAERGHVVMATGRDAGAMLDLPRETAMGGLLETATPAEAMARTTALFGRLDAIVATPAASLFEVADPLELSPDRVLAPLAALLGLVHEATPLLGRGRILLVAPPLAAGLSAAVIRGAMEALTEPLRAALAGRGTDVIAILTELGRSRRMRTASALAELALTALVSPKPRPRYVLKLGAA